MYQDDSELSVVFRDVLSLIVAATFVLILILLPHINPVTKKDAEDARPAGHIAVWFFWEDNLDYDVDLWVQAPGDVPVGYSNKSSTIFSLLRDDLGMVGDVTPRNYEVAYTRGIPDGWYVVNAHLYSVRADEHGFRSVTVESVLEIYNSGSTHRLKFGTITLSKVGEEVTVGRVLIQDKQVVAQGHSHTPLRSAGASPQPMVTDPRMP